MGAQCIISGIRPQIAQTIVSLGIEFGEIVTKATPGRRAAVRAARDGRRRGPAHRPGRRCRAAAMDRVPVLTLGDVLLVSIQVDLEDRLAVRLQEDLAERIVATGAHGVLIDITALDIVDSFVGRMLATIASVSKVLDAETVVVGMRPAVAITLVELGLPLRGIRTALNVELGLSLLRAAPARPSSTTAGRERRRSPTTPRGVWPARDDQRGAVRPGSGPDDLERRRRGPGPPARPVGRRGDEAHAWSTRPRSSPRRASWPATRSSTAAAGGPRCSRSATAGATACGSSSSTRVRASPTSTAPSPTATPPGVASASGSPGPAG